MESVCSPAEQKVYLKEINYCLNSQWHHSVTCLPFILLPFFLQQEEIFSFDNKSVFEIKEIIHDEETKPITNTLKPVTSNYCKHRLNNPIAI